MPSFNYCIVCILQGEHLLQDQNTSQNKRLTIDTVSQSPTIDSNNIGYKFKTNHKIPQLPPSSFTPNTPNTNGIILPLLFAFESNYCRTE